MMKLNPKAASFYPSAKPNLTSMERYHQGYVVSSPSLVTTLPPPPYYHQPYFYGGAREDVHNLHPETAIDSDKKQEDASIRDSKRRILRAMFNGYGRRFDQARHTKGFRPPRLSRRPNGTASCGRRIQDAALGNFKVSPRNKKTKQPLVLVERERNTTIMIRNIPNRYTFVSEPK